MKLRDLDSKMRGFEGVDDLRVEPGVFMVARLDGRGFGRLVREVLGYEDPYPASFRDAMVDTVRDIMRGGFHVIYGHTQSDEISLLFHPESPDFGRRLRKYYSVLAGLASASFSLRLGTLATFDCRISRLPDVDTVIDYFEWRALDAERNALNTRCQWALRQAGASPREISDALHRATAKTKKRLLSSDHGVTFGELPGWCRRGVGLYWQGYEDVIPEPTGPRPVLRQRIHADLELPSRRAYATDLRTRLSQALDPSAAPERADATPAQAP